MLHLASIQFRGVTGVNRVVPLRRGGHAGEEIEPPEWRQDLPAGQHAAAAYVPHGEARLAVKARLRRAESSEAATYTIRAEDATGANLLGAVAEATLVFAAGQAESSIELPLTGAVVGTRAARHLDFWRWIAKKSPAGEDQEIALTSQVIYSLLGTPQAPWSVAPSRPAEWVWTTALDRACEWGGGAVTIEQACTLLTQRWYGLGRLPSGQSWTYTRASKYAMDAGRFRLGLLLAQLAGQVNNGSLMVNCTDTAAAVATLANALGAKLTEIVSNPVLPSNPAPMVRWLGEAIPRPASGPHDFAVESVNPAEPVWDGCLVLVAGASTTPVHGIPRLGQNGYCAKLWGTSGCTAPFRARPRSMTPYPEEARAWSGRGVLARRGGIVKDTSTFFFHFQWSADDLPGWALRSQRVDGEEVRLIESDWQRPEEPERSMYIAVTEWGSDEEADAAFARWQSEYRGSFRLGQLGVDPVVWDDAGMGGILRIENLVIDVALPVSEAGSAHTTIESVWSVLRGAEAGNVPSSHPALELPLTNAAGEPLWYALTAEQARFARRGLHIELTTAGVDTPQAVTLRAHTGANRFESNTTIL
ncbi:MAG: hypothetical protein IT368_15385 [Candidatus Hydrogenedentes bacterium]|nr:hypothetical protein [Candidatus Hydrogenedentota bacterium]